MSRRFWLPIAAGISLAAGAVGDALQTDHLTGTDFATNHASIGYPLQVRKPGEARIAVPTGTTLSAVLQITLSPKLSRAGDLFSARLESPVKVDGQIAIPEGAALHGHVGVAEQAGPRGEGGKLQLIYDSISFDGRAYPIDSDSEIYESVPLLELDAGQSLWFTLDREVIVRPAPMV